MKRWPRHQVRTKRVDALSKVLVYRRKDKAGVGPCVSLYVNGVEVVRCDLFEVVPHYHRHPKLDRIGWEPGLPFARYVDLAIKAMATWRPSVTRIADWVRAELG